MVVTQPGENPSTTLSQYVGPTTVVDHPDRGKVYLFDAGTGQIIAELTPDAAAAVRQRRPGHIGVDNAGGTIKNPDLTMED